MTPPPSVGVPKCDPSSVSEHLLLLRAAYVQSGPQLDCAVRLCGYWSTAGSRSLCATCALPHLSYTCIFLMKSHTVVVAMPLTNKSSTPSNNNLCEESLRTCHLTGICLAILDQTVVFFGLILLDHSELNQGEGKSTA